MRSRTQGAPKRRPWALFCHPVGVKSKLEGRSRTQGAPRRRPWAMFCHPVGVKSKHPSRTTDSRGMIPVEKLAMPEDTVELRRQLEELQAENMRLRELNDLLRA